jgi:co-chaperonin GroES (HSP10)
MPLNQVHKIKNLKPLNDNVLVIEMNFKERITSSGIILPTDDGKTTGIRPRWGQVYAIGPNQTDVNPGDWICVAHGRWTRGIEIEDDQGLRTVRKIDPKDILLISDELPTDDTMSTSVHAEQKSR